jgi:H+/Cl- antiporter ClcA
MGSYRQSWRPWRAKVCTVTAPSIPPAPESGQPLTNPWNLLRSPSDLTVLVFSALIGVPVAGLTYGFLKLVDAVQVWLFQTLPSDLGFGQTPGWWPLPVLVIGGLATAALIQYLPGQGGHEPCAGLAATGHPAANALPGIALAGFVTLACGAVLGPEAPLIALGAGLSAAAMRYTKQASPQQAIAIVGAAGSFAAISTLLGSPILGAFLLMEAAGLAGPVLGIVLVPGLLAAGIGSLVFIGLDNLAGWGTFSLAVPNIPAFDTVTGYELLWGIAIGVLAAAAGTTIRVGAIRLQPAVARRRIVLTGLSAAGVAVAAIAFQQMTGKGADQVLFSGENALAPLIQGADTWTAGALAALVVCKSAAYTLSLSGFRGGPTFPAMFIGAAGGTALSHLPGLPPIAGAAMGIGAMSVTMLGLPLTSVLLTALFLQTDRVTLMPLIIVAVVVAYITSAQFTPAAPPTPPHVPTDQPATVSTTTPNS